MAKCKCADCGCEYDDEEAMAEATPEDLLDFLMIRQRALEELCIGKKLFSKRALESKISKIVEEINEDIEEAQQSAILEHKASNKLLD